MPPTLRDDCFRTTQPSLRHDDAIGLFRSRIQCIAETEQIPLQDARARILAEKIIANRPIPLHNNAAVDGYAFRNTDYNTQTDNSLLISGRVAAGTAQATATPSGAAVRIFTGAALPPDLDTVVMQEDVSLEPTPDGEKVTIPPGLKPGANVRPAGEDVAEGAKLFDPGHIIRAQDLGAIASVGRATVACRKPLSIAILSTGDEIVRPGTPLKLGQVYDANSTMLAGLCAPLQVNPTDLGILPDKADVVRDALRDTAAAYDVILTSGGASTGEEDHMASAIDALGERHFWRIAIKPGRPLMFGQIGNTVIVGLPGNPIAVFVCFLLYVYPMLRALGGAPWPEPRRFLLPADFEVQKRKTGRREFWRGSIANKDGRMVATKFPRDGSGLISSLRVSDGLIDVAEDTPAIARGDEVAFIPYSEFGIIGA